MSKKTIYDLPIRLFHWLFAALFITAFLIAKTIDDDSPTFSFHMLAGILMSFVVFCRIIWGLFGSKYAQFKSLALHPRDLVSYFKGILTGEKRKWTGHNPASSWVSILMMGITLSLGLTGYLMANGQKEQFEDIHELLANGFLFLVIFHIAGIFLHTLRHKDGIYLSMIHGKKSDDSTNTSISNVRPGYAIAFLVLIAGFSTVLYKNYNSQMQTLNFFGKELQLGEAENEENNIYNENEHEED